ncbi:hypothetical protein AGMMS49957_16530 [Synergistales bacterium]|nr:hypothetical protein AGMMS49957_16530 [Synergistales bacterium]
MTHKEKEAKTAASALLSDTKSLMGACPPVNLGVICKHLGIEVYTMPCASFGAVFSRTDAGGRILVNLNLKPGRFRFSIAHELGHFTLNHRPSFMLADDMLIQGDIGLERQADIFASELLLPEALLRSDLRRGGFSVAELAKRYKVSQQALEIKLRALSARAVP